MLQSGPSLADHNVTPLIELPTGIRERGETKGGSKQTLPQNGKLACGEAL